jgi:DHA2 family multidrug resistance protein
MIGMPFLFVPITTASYGELPPEKTNQASALINVARNLGGSIGVSMAITLLAQRSQFHQARLTEHLFPSSPQYQQTIHQLASYFAAQGASHADALREAIGAVGQLVRDQALLLAYIDVFASMALLAALMIPVVLLLLRSVKRRATPAVH